MIIYDFILAICAGLITSCWGAYKDSPYESFSPISFVRSILVSFLYYFGIKYFLAFGSFSAHPLLVMFSAIAFERLTQEVYKAFFRKNQRENVYKIPQSFHYMGNVFEYNERILMGMGAIVLAVIIFYLLSILEVKGNNWIWWSLLVSIFPTAGGAYKDAPIEGFDIKKFPRSFIVMFLSIVLMHSFTNSMIVLISAGAGLERVLVEFYKTFVIKSVPGKFIGYVISPEWTSKRKIFMYTYLAAILIVIASTIYFIKLR